jgi:peptidoglycan/LPS O-acetylase OafA/YrhL
MYLLHFPLQLLAVIGVVHFYVDPQVFNRLAFMILFFMALVLASWISRQYFETPIKKHLLSGLAR